jgi:fumarate hydratase class II
VIDSQLDDHFRWRSGRPVRAQSNMNANEVISNRAIELLGGCWARSRRCTNDHVNLSQSSNDTYPTAMHIAAAEVVRSLIPALQTLQGALDARPGLGPHHPSAAPTQRHAADARPGVLRLRAASGQRHRAHRMALPVLMQLARGGTAVGTGLNAPVGFAEQVAAKIRNADLPFTSAPNKFEALAAPAPWCSPMARSYRGRQPVQIASDIRSGRRPALRPGRASLRREQAGAVDHARQGQPDPVRGPDHGLHPRVRQ